GRTFHPSRPRRGIARTARVIATRARRRRNRTAAAIKGAITSRPALLRRLFRPRSTYALLPTKLAGVRGRPRPGGWTHPICPSEHRDLPLLVFTCLRITST